MQNSIVFFVNILPNPQHTSLQMLPPVCSSGGEIKDSWEVTTNICQTCYQNTVSMFLASYV